MQLLIIQFSPAPSFPQHPFLNILCLCMISGFHHKVAENCALLGCYVTMVISYWCCRTTYQPYPQGSRIWILKPWGCPETSV